MTVERRSVSVDKDTNELVGDEEVEEESVELGYVPVMLKSKRCHLRSLRNGRELANAGECLYDQV